MKSLLLKLHPGRSRWGLTGVIAVVALTITLTACGDDSSTSVNDEESSSSVALSSSSVTLSGASAKSNGSSDGKMVSSSSMKNSASSSSVPPVSVSGAASSSSGVQPTPNKFSKILVPISKDYPRTPLHRKIRRDFRLAIFASVASHVDRRYRAQPLF